MNLSIANRIICRCIVTGSAALCAMVMLSQSAEACTVTYADYGLNAAGTAVEVWSEVTDYYDQSYCDPVEWGYSDGYFEHEYEVFIQIWSPDGERLVTGNGSANAALGGGSAS